MYVTNNKTIKQAIISGITATDISFSETFAIPHPTNRFIPTGGVTRPIDKFRTITAPKCIGSIPKLNATGRNNGVKIKTALVASMKQPAIRKMTLGSVEKLYW